MQRNSTDPVSTFLAKTNWTIHDEDTGAIQPSYSVAASPNPVNENGGSVTFTINRSGASPAETLFLSTLQGSTNGYSANGSDYNGLLNQQVTFSAGQTSAQVTISVINDAASELDETFGAILQRNPTDPVATYLAKTDWTIHDDDAAPTNYAVSASASPVAENAGSITFTVTRSGSSLPAETIYASNGEQQRLQRPGQPAGHFFRQIRPSPR